MLNFVKFIDTGQLVESHLQKKNVHWLNYEVNHIGMNLSYYRHIRVLRLSNSKDDASPIGMYFYNSN